MGILIIGMRYEFGPDVKLITPMIDGIIERERKHHKIYHWNSETVDYSKDVKIDLERGDIAMVEATEKEDFIYVMGLHFGRCLDWYGKLIKCPIGIVLNATLAHPKDKWDKLLKLNAYPLYLWGEKQGFYELFATPTPLLNCA